MMKKTILVAVVIIVVLVTWAWMPYINYCQADSDCRATCAYGCISNIGPINDCQGLLHYTCECVNSVCSRWEPVGSPVITGTANVDIAGGDIEWKQGAVSMMPYAIRNAHDEDRGFYINIHLESLAGELAGVPVEEKADEVRRWVTFSSFEYIESGKTQLVEFIMKPRGDTEPGIYRFELAVCEKEQGGWENCTAGSEFLYGSDSFSLEFG